MEVEALIQALSDPAAYPELAGDEVVGVHQTHISVVFLAGPFAYKVKKPVAFGFVDYDTLEKRREFCELELLLNRRLAPSVYLGTIPITDDDGSIRMGGVGQVIEWAVKMTRLPEASTLGDRLRRGEIGPEQVAALARRIARFHAEAEAGLVISKCGEFSVVAGNARENLTQSASNVGTTISRPVFERLEELTERWLDLLRPTIEDRARRGVPRDGHGDLRLDHVYLFPEKQPPDDMIVVDAIEFAERFRHADPVADMAFLAMDFSRYGRRDLRRVFTEAYFRASGDAEGRTLLPFYAAYRAAVRGKVEGLKYLESEIAEPDRAEALEKSRASWLLALGELEVSGRRPCLVLVGGLPGTGKSTLARDLAEHSGFTVIRSDLVRKDLAGLAEGEPAPAGYGRGIYSREWNERTYAECSRQAEALLFEGERVLVDASFGREADRRCFLELAARLGVTGIFFHCLAESAVVRGRLKDRRHDASDADWSTYLEAEARWEEPGPTTRRSTREIATGDRERAISSAGDVLRDLGLAD